MTFGRRQVRAPWLVRRALRGAVRFWWLPLCGLGLALCACLGLEEHPARARTEYGSFPEEALAVWRRELELSLPEELAPRRARRLDASAEEAGWALQQLIVGPVGAPPGEGGLLDLLASDAFLRLWAQGEVDGAAGEVADLLALARGGDRALLQAAAEVLAAPEGHHPEAAWRWLSALVGDQQLHVVDGLAGSLDRHEGRLALVHDGLGTLLRSIEPPNPGAVFTPEDYEGPALDRWLLRSACSTPCGALLADADSAECRGCLADVHGLGGASAPSVRVDAFGDPAVLPARDGGLPPPFVDGDGDRLPDRGPSGARIDASGAPITLPALTNPGSEEQLPPGVVRDSRGRALLAGEATPVYEYVDLETSLLGMAAELAARLAEEAQGGRRTSLDELLAALPLLLGPAVEGADGAHYDPDAGLLADFAFGVLELLRYPHIKELLSALSAVIQARPDLLDRLLAEVGRVALLDIPTPPIETLLGEGPLLDHFLGDNPFRAMEWGSRCDLRWGAEACPASWLRCVPSDDDGGTRCQLVATAAGPAGLLEEMSDLGILTAVLHAAGTDPRLATVGAPLARMMGHRGTDLTSLAGTAGGVGGCAGGWPPPSGLMEYPWGAPVLRDQACTYEPYDPVISSGPPGCSALQKAWALFYDTSRLLYRPDPSLIICEPGGREALITLMGGDDNFAVVPDALQMDNVAGFYLDSVVGNARVSSRLLGDSMDNALVREAVGGLLCELTLEERDDDVLRAASEQLNLWALRDHGSLARQGAEDCALDLGNAVDHQGLEVRHHHADMLVAAATGVPRGGEGSCRYPVEAAQCDLSLLGALAPLIELHSFHGVDGGAGPGRGMQAPAGRTQLAVDLASTLHVHWSTLQAHSRCALAVPLQTPDDATCWYRPDPLRGLAIYAFNRQEGTGLSDWEPLMIGIIEQTELLPVTFELLQEAERGCEDVPGGGGCLSAELSRLLAWLLDRDSYGLDWWFRSEPRVVGKGAGMPLPGGGGTDPRPARAQLIVAPLRRLLRQRTLPEHAEALQAWERVDLVDLLIAPRPDGRVGRRAALHLAREVLVLASEELDDDLATPRGQARWAEDLDEVRDQLLELLASPATYQLSQLWSEASDTDRAWLSDLVRAGLRTGDTRADDRRAHALQAAVDLLRLRMAPGTLARAGIGLGALLPTGRRPALDLVARLESIAAVDPEGLTSAAAQNLFTEDASAPRSRFPLLELASVVGATLRVDPQRQPPEPPLTAADLAQIADKAQRLLQDPDHGVPRLADIVRLRLQPQASQPGVASEGLGR